MQKKYRQGAEAAFRAIANHLATKRFELRVAAEIGRGIEGWVQHEMMVALTNAWMSDLAGRLDYAFGREMLASDSSAAKKRPFDLWLDDPAMGAAVKFYLPWESVGAATRGVRKDLLAIAEDELPGFFILGQIDWRDGLGWTGGRKRQFSGEAWCEKVMAEAGTGIRLTPLVPALRDDGNEYLEVWLPPMPHWEEGEPAPRTPVMHLAAWLVEPKA